MCAGSRHYRASFIGINPDHEKGTIQTQQDAPTNVSASCCFLYRVFLPHSLPHDFFQQSLVSVHHIINYIAITYCLEMFPCAVDFCLFNWSNVVKMQGIQSAFGLGNEVNMLDRSFIESDCPVRIISPYRGRNIEAVRQFNIDCNISICIQLL